MNKQDSNTSHTPICNFVPGYAFYNEMGTNLAEQLVNFIEWLITLKR